MQLARSTLKKTASVTSSSNSNIWRAKTDQGSFSRCKNDTSVAKSKEDESKEIPKRWYIVLMYL